MPEIKFDSLFYSISKDISINGIAAKAIIHRLSLDRDDEKKIVTLQPIQRGNLIDYDGHKWLIISDVPGKRLMDRYVGLIKRCNYTLKFNVNCVVKEYPAIIEEANRFDTVDGKIMVVPVGGLMVTMQDNADIVLDQRFISMGSAWKIKGIDKTQNGLMRCFCEKDLFAPDDDIPNEIANKCPHDYAITINNGDTAIIIEGDTIQLTATVTDGGTPIANPAIIWTSDNTDIATVDANGLVTAIVAGMVNITATFEGVSDTISLTVEAIPVQDNFALSITGVSSVKQNGTQTYTATLTNNGVVVPIQPTTWSISNTAQATITSQTDDTCVVKGLKSSGSFVLRVVLDSDPNVFAEKTITNVLW